jgi:hypothetical protein
MVLSTAVMLQSCDRCSRTTAKRWPTGTGTAVVGAAVGVVGVVVAVVGVVVAVVGMVVLVVVLGAIVVVVLGAFVVVVVGVVVVVVVVLGVGVGVVVGMVVGVVVGVVVLVGTAPCSGSKLPETDAFANATWPTATATSTTLGSLTRCLVGFIGCA